MPMSLRTEGGATASLLWFVCRGLVRGGLVLLGLVVCTLVEKKIKYLLEGLTKKFRKISYFKSNKTVSCKQNNEGMILFLDKKEVNPINTIIKIEL